MAADSSEASNASSPNETSPNETSPNETSPSESSSSSGVLRWVLYGTGGLVALLVAAILLLPQLFPEERLKAFVIPPMEEALQRDVTIDGIGLRVLPSPAVRVSDFSVANAEGFDAQPALSARAFNVEVALFPLLTGTIEPTAVELVEPVVRYQIAEDGSTNFDTFGAPADTAAAEEASAAPSIAVSNFRTTGARLLYDDASTGQSAEIVFDAQLSAIPGAGDVFDSEGQLDLSTIRAVLPAADEGAPADTVALRDATLRYALGYALNEGRLDLRDLSLETAPLSLTASGTVADLSARPSLDLNVTTGETDLSQLAAFLPPGTLGDVQPSGTVALDVTVSGLAPDSTGSLDDLTVEGSGSLAGIGVDYDGTTMLSDLGADLALSLDALTVSSINGRLLGKPLQGEVSVTDLMNEPMLDGRLAGTADLAQLTSLAESEEEIEGSADYDVRFSGAATNPDAIRVNGPVTLSGIRYVTETLREPLTISNATINLTGRGLTMDRFTMQTGDYRMALSAQVRNLLPVSKGLAETNPAMTASFTLTSDRLDMIEMFPEETDSTITYSTLFAAQLSGTRVNGRPADEVAQEVYGDVEIPPYTVDGRVEVGTLLNPPQRFDDLAMDLTMQGRRLSVRNLTAETYGGQLTGSMTIDQSATASALAPRYEDASVLMASGDGGAAPRRLRPAPDGAMTYDFDLKGAKAGAFLQDWTTLGQFVNGSMDLTFKGDSPLTRGFLPIAQALKANGQSIVANGGFSTDFPLPSALVDKIGVGRETFADFKRLGGAFTIEDGQFKLGDWAFNNPNVQGELTGAFGLGGSVDVGFTAQMPLSLVRKSGLSTSTGLGGILGKIAGQDEQIPVTMGIGGTMSDPQVQVDSDALKETLRELAPSARDRIRGIFDGGKR